MNLNPRVVLAGAAGVLAMAIFASSAVAAEPVSLLFSYFVKNGEDGLHFAASTDGLTFTPLGGGRSYLTPRVGNSKLMRDPCLLRGPDGTFHLVWTDSWEGQTIGYASSPDLIHWSEQRALPVMAHEPGARNCWAPEIAYDETRGEFVIFWATTITGKFPETLSTEEKGYNHRIYATTTKDFATFTPTRLFYEPGFNVIDATLLRVAGKVRLIVKDETRTPPKKNLRIASAATVAGPFTDLSAPFTPPGLWVEGPTAIQLGENTVVYYDCYRDKHYGAMRSRDLKTWEDITAQIHFPAGTRHGTVVAVPVELVAHLREAP